MHKLKSMYNSPFKDSYSHHSPLFSDFASYGLQQIHQRKVLYFSDLDLSPYNLSDINTKDFLMAVAHQKDDLIERWTEQFE